MSNPICIYHRTDFDGICSAAIVLQKFPKADLVGYNYGDKLDLEQFRDRYVIFVDCALQPFARMIELSLLASKVLWIDHHATAIEEFKSCGGIANFEAYVAVGKAGCELTWEYFVGGQLPLAVLWLGRYDVWDHEISQVLPFQYGMRGKHSTQGPESSLWEQLLYSDVDSRLLSDILNEGRTILKYQNVQNNVTAKSAFERELWGLKLICLNRGGCNSQVLDSVADPEKHDAMLLYSYTGSHWTFSLFSVRPVDVGVVAQRLGGGGHRGAAGFQLDTLPKGLG